MEQVYRIGIDHGYGNIKTAHHIFESGVIERERASELTGMMVEYEGKFYEIGSTHKEYQMDKVWDEDYYILTLAALAKELKGRGLCNASVILAVGLPIKWLGEQGEGFRKYLLRNKEVSFRCNDTRYHVKIEDVEVYAQGFAAVAADLSSYQRFNIVADIGEKYLKAIAECASDYTDKIMRKLREYGYNEELAKLHGRARDGCKGITVYHGARKHSSHYGSL